MCNHSVCFRVLILNINILMFLIILFVSERLNVEADIVQNAVIGIMHLLTEATKIMVIIIL